MSILILVLPSLCCFNDVNTIKITCISGFNNHRPYTTTTKMRVKKTFVLIRISKQNPISFKLGSVGLDSEPR